MYIGTLRCTIGAWCIIAVIEYSGYEFDMYFML